MKIAIFLSARNKSSRLKDKEVLPFGPNGDVVIDFLIKRLKKNLDNLPVIFTTSYYKDDYVFDSYASEHDIEIYHGHPEDKLDRYYDCMKKMDITHAIIIDGDNVFSSLEAISKVRDQFLQGKHYVYFSKDVPDGLYCYGFSFAALYSVMTEKTTPYTEVWGQMFKDTVKREDASEIDLAPFEFSDKLRVTLDYPEDYAFMLEMAKRLDFKEDFLMDDFLRVLDEEVMDVNSSRIEEYRKNLQKVINEQNKKQ